MKNSQMVKPSIIPVASGKGGVGKSLFSANLAMALAGLGYKVVAVDLDLGGSNLHTYLGLANEHPGIGDFLAKKGSDLQEFLTPVGYSPLSFLAGDGLTPFMANLGYAQKMRLMRALSKLPADYVIMDLGAGSSYNTLDFFGMVNDGVALTTPDHASIMNLMAFLKNRVLRSIAQEVKRVDRLKKIVESARKQPLNEQMKTVAELIADIGRVCPDSAERVAAKLSGMRPRIAVNMVRYPDDLDFLQNVRDSLQRRLSLEIEYVGSVSEDPEACTVERWKRPSSPILQDSPVVKDISAIAGRLTGTAETFEGESFDQVLAQCKSRFAQAV